MRSASNNEHSPGQLERGGGGERPTHAGGEGRVTEPAGDAFHQHLAGPLGNDHGT